MDILTEHRDGEITVFANNSTPEIHLTTRRAEAKEEVAENMGAVTTVADNMEEVKGAAKYAQTFDDVLLNLPTIIKAMHAAETAVQAKDDAISAKESAQESAEKAESAVVRAEEVTAEQVELAKGYAEQAKTEVSKVSSAFKIVGTVPTVEDLPKNAEVGNIYLVGDNSITNKPEYVWTSGGTWEKFGETVDLSAYQTKEEAETALAEKQDTLTAGEGIKIEGNVISTEGGKLPDNVYTSDNLIAGKNVTFTEVPPEGGIDEHTLACWHFDGSNVDSVASKSLSSAYLATDYFKFGTGSAYWWGGLASISTSYTNADATMDLWALLPSTSDSVTMTLDGQLYTSQGQIIWWVVKLEKNKIIFGKIPSLGGAITETASADFSFPNTEFVHIAFQRSNNTNYQVFANGQKVIDVEIDELPSFNKIGLTSTTAARIDELRISDCVRYTEDFTPPTQAYTVATGPSKTAVNAVVAVPTKTSELENDSGFLTGLPDNVYTQTNLLGGKDIEIIPEPVEGGIDEYTLGVFHCETSSYNTNAVEGGGSLKGSTFSTNTDYFKFGESSLYAGSSSPYYYMSTSQIKEESDWTVDGWIRLTGWPGTKASAGCGQSGSSFSWKVEISHDNNEAYICYQNNSSIIKTSSYTIPTDEWVHFAAEKDGNTINGYVNGVKIISYTDDSVKNTTSKRYPFLQAYEAYLDEIRFSSIARYKGQPFTPPNKAYEVAEPTGNMVVNFVGESLQKGADYVVESYNEGTNWYRVYKSGWVEQGGIVQSDASAAKTFSFLKPFADGNYTLIAHVDSTDNYVKSANTHTLTSTSFIYKVVTDGGGLLAMTIRWRAEGKGA